jgi:hypothetical protein
MVDRDAGSFPSGSLPLIGFGATLFLLLVAGVTSGGVWVAIAIGWLAIFAATGLIAEWFADLSKSRR